MTAHALTRDKSEEVGGSIQLRSHGGMWLF